MVLCQVCNQPIDSEHAEHVSAKFCRHHYNRKHIEPTHLHNSEQAKIFLQAKNSDWALVNSTNYILIDHGKNNAYRTLSRTTAKDNFLYTSRRIDRDFALAVGVKVIPVDKVEEAIAQADEAVKLSSEASVIAYLTSYDFAWVSVDQNTGEVKDGGFSFAGLADALRFDADCKAYGFFSSHGLKGGAGFHRYKELVKPTIPQAVKGESAAETVAMRESVYGPFAVHAKAEQDMKRAMTSQPGWEKLNDVQKSAAEMIVHKLARILNASPDYDDNWHDISGYANLAENDIKNRTRTKPDSSESV